MSQPNNEIAKQIEANAENLIKNAENEIVTMAATAVAEAAAAAAAAATPATANMDVNNSKNSEQSSAQATATILAVNGETNAAAAAQKLNAPPAAPPQLMQTKLQEPTALALNMSADENAHESATSQAKMDNDAALFNFKIVYVVAQLCGLTLIVLMGSWVGIHLGGLSGPSNPAIEFNWHPLLMTIGLIFLYGNSILVYRGFRSTRKKTLKLAHAGIHMGAFILTVIGLQAAFDSHNLRNPPIPNMYSLHSWLGLSAVIIFALQYVAGFAAFLAPGFKDQYKIALMPLHIYFGIFGFALAIVACLLGLFEKTYFSVPNFTNLPSGAVMANVMGVLFVVFGGLVVFLVTEPNYKRKPLPEDAVLLTGMSE